MGKRNALLVGVEKYKNYPPLKSPMRDVRSLKSILNDKSIGRFDKVDTVTNTSKQFADEKILHFLNGQEYDDLLLIYFSGHGVFNDNDELFLPFINTTKGSSLPATAIAVKYLTKQIKECRARQKILILDCCFSGLAGKDKAGERKLTTKDLVEMSPESGIFYTSSAQRGFVILTSSGEYQVSKDDAPESKENLSLFTHYLVYGLKDNKIAPQNGQIKLYEWFLYAEESVRVSSGEKQTPQIFVTRNLDVAIAYASPTEPLPVTPAVTVPVYPAPIRDDKMTFVGMDFMRIPEGKFMMGCNDYANEQPQHEVNIPYDYWMGKHLVTNEQYARFVNAFHKTHPVHEWQNKRKHPVVNTTWLDVNNYVLWLNKRVSSLPSDLEFRLPTEAEWEKAARHTDGRIYPWGNVFDPHKCNSRESGRNDTTPVGYYSPLGDSFYGCADMAGNVWEWTCSTPKEYPYVATDGRQENNDNVGHVLRGGSYYSNKDKVRTSERDNYQPYETYECRGIRVVLAPRFPK